jgi:hypothetical protein
VWTKSFWLDAIERSIKTACQVAAAAIGTTGVGITALDFMGIASVAATAALFSILTSVGSSAATGQHNATLLNKPE